MAVPIPIRDDHTLPDMPIASRPAASLASVATPPPGHRVERPPADATVRLLLPVNDVANPEITIVVPALNEELTIADFVAWCQEGLARTGRAGEILIVSSSSDRTDELALAGGARVLATPKRGLGRAYIDAVPYIRGRYVIVGDADCTYDFREIGAFVEKLDDGYEFVMGSRMRGTIEPKAMPVHHRYFGTPITNWILNLLFSSHYSDIHCGMRALTTDALQRIDLNSQGWEYASEMILKSLHLDLRACEIPINFYRDRSGRVSNLKRAGWVTPFKAGWDNLRIMFTYGADFFLYRPGIALAAIGLVATAVMTPGPVQVGSVVLTTTTQFLAVALSIIGVSSLYLGVLARVLNDLTGTATRTWLRRFSYNRTFLISSLLVLAGLGLDANLVAVYLAHGSLPPSVGWAVHLAITGVLLITIGFMSFTFCLVLHAAAGRLIRPGSVDLSR